MHHSRRSVLIRSARSLGRHAFTLMCAYGAAAFVSALALWMMFVVLDSVVWATRMVGIKAGWQDLVAGDNPLLIIVGGLLFLPIGTMAAAMFLPPVMLVAYPLAVVVARRVDDRRRVAAIGAFTGSLLAPVILAVWRYFDQIPAYRTTIAQDYAVSVPVTFLPSLAAGATIGWIVATLQERSTIPAGASA